MGKNQHDHGHKLHYYIPNVLLAFLLSFLIFGSALMILIFNVLLKPETYTDQMYKNKVDEEACKEIYQYFDRQYNYTGVAPETLKKSTDQKDITAAVYAYVDSTFDYINGKTNKLPQFEYDFTSLEENLHKDYEDWAAENNTTLDAKTKKIEKKTFENIKSLINSKLDIMMFSHINKENGISTKIRNSLGTLKKVGYALGAVTIIIIAAIILLNRKHSKYTFYWISCGFFCSSMLMIIPAAILKFTKYFDGLAIKNESIYKAFVSSLYSITDRVLITGIILFAFAAVLMFLYIAARKNMFKFKYLK